MGSPPRSWEHSDDIMEVDNIYSAFFARDNLAEILNGKNSWMFYILFIVTYHYDLLEDVPDAMAEGLRIASQLFPANPPPHLFSSDPPPQRFGSHQHPQRFGPHQHPQRFGSHQHLQRFGSYQHPQMFGSNSPPQMFGSDPPPQNEVDEPLNLVNPVHLIHPVDPVDAVQYDETSSDSIVCFMFYIIHSIINKVH